MADDDLLLRKKQPALQPAIEPSDVMRNRRGGIDRGEQHRLGLVESQRQRKADKEAFAASVPSATPRMSAYDINAIKTRQDNAGKLTYYPPGDARGTPLAPASTPAPAAGSVNPDALGGRVKDARGFVDTAATLAKQPSSRTVDEMTVGQGAYQAKVRADMASRMASDPRAIAAKSRIAAENADRAAGPASVEDRVAGIASTLKPGEYIGVREGGTSSMISKTPDGLAKDTAFAMAQPARVGMVRNEAGKMVPIGPETKRIGAAYETAKINAERNALETAAVVQKNQDSNPAVRAVTAARSAPGYNPTRAQTEANNATMARGTAYSVPPRATAAPKTAVASAPPPPKPPAARVAPAVPTPPPPASGSSVAVVPPPPAITPAVTSVSTTSRGSAFVPPIDKVTEDRGDGGSLTREQQLAIRDKIKTEVQKKEVAEAEAKANADKQERSEDLKRRAERIKRQEALAKERALESYSRRRQGGTASVASAWGPSD